MNLINAKTSKLLHVNLIPENASYNRWSLNTLPSLQLIITSWPRRRPNPSWKEFVKTASVSVCCWKQWLYIVSLERSQNKTTAFWRTGTAVLPHVRYHRFTENDQMISGYRTVIPYLAGREWLGENTAEPLHNYFGSLKHGQRCSTAWRCSC